MLPPTVTYRADITLGKRSMTIHEALCRAIWNNTYKHDTLLEWHEIKRGTLHHERVVAAAKAAYAAMQ